MRISREEILLARDSNPLSLKNYLHHRDCDYPADPIAPNKKQVPLTKASLACKRAQHLTELLFTVIFTGIFLATASSVYAANI